MGESTEAVVDVRSETLVDRSAAEGRRGEQMDGSEVRRRWWRRWRLSGTDGRRPSKRERDIALGDVSGLLHHELPLRNIG